MEAVTETGTETLVSKACDHCGASGADVVLVGTDRRHGLGGRFRIVQCDACGLARTDPRPEDLSAWYPEDDYFNYGERLDFAGRVFATVVARTATAPGHPVVRRAQLALVPAADLGGVLPTGSRVLDLGAASGHAVAAFRDAGLDAHGLEVSKAAVETAQRLGRGTVEQGSVEDAGREPGAWDLVRLWHTLEHVTSVATALASCYAALAPGGRVVVGVPNFGGFGRRLFGEHWDGLELPRHLFHFTAPTLRGCLEQAGFFGVRVRTTAVPGVLAGSIDARTRRSDVQRSFATKPMAGAVFWPIELVAGFAGVGDGLWAVAYRPG